MSKSFFRTREDLLESSKIDEEISQTSEQADTVGALKTFRAPPILRDQAPMSLASRRYVDQQNLDNYMHLDLPSFMQENREEWQIVKGEGNIKVVNVDTVAMKRAEIRSGVRTVTLCKDDKGLMGLVVQNVDNGLYVCFVYEESPAQLASLRFGDHILIINEEPVAGWTTEKAMKYLEKTAPEKIELVVRDRPLAQTYTILKDPGTGSIGFVYLKGKITDVIHSSGAEKNGLPTNRQILEVNGVNVVGYNDKEIEKKLQDSEHMVTLTVMPRYLYKEIIKKLDTKLLKKHMSHKVTDLPPAKRQGTIVW